MNLHDYIIRPASADDALAILAAHRAAVRGGARAFYDPLIIEEWSPQQPSPERILKLKENLSSGEEIGLVAVAPDETVIAYGSIVPSRLILGAVYVHPDYSNQGLGKCLLNELELLAKKADLTELSMDASLNAEHFYQSHGYTIEGRGEHLLRSGRSMACVKMRKIL